MCTSLSSPASSTRKARRSPTHFKSLGFSGVEDVRQGKLILLELAERDPANARAAVEAMCEKLLANTVIETYAIDIVP